MRRFIPFRLQYVVIVSALVLSGCAEVRVTRLAPNDSSSPGVRYYGAQPYLLVSVPGTSGENDSKAASARTTASSFQAQILWLPKMNEQYAVTVKPGWGAADGSVALKDGWMLTSLGAKIDSKAPETIAAISGLLTGASNAVKVYGPAATNASRTVTILYRMKFNSDGDLQALVPVTLNFDAR